MPCFLVSTKNRHSWCLSYSPCQTLEWPSLFPCLIPGFLSLSPSFLITSILHFPAVRLMAGTCSEIKLDCSEIKMHYRDLELKGFWMPGPIVLFVRREQTSSFKHGGRSKGWHTGEAELHGSTPGQQSITLDPRDFFINGQPRSHDSLDHHYCCLKIPQENISNE